MSLEIGPYVSLNEQAQLSALLAQPHRGYHNINHINDCIAESHGWWNGIDTSKVPTWSLRALTLISWYHDSVYNPYAPAGRNEGDSEVLFSSIHYPKDCVGDDLFYRYDTVSHAISYTARHIEDIGDELTQLHDNTNINGELIKVFLDIDLTGFGKAWWVTASHSLGIRKEYPNTSDMDFIQGRLKFLTKFNERNSFYYTDYFKNKYHAKSKENVAYEIELLQTAIEHKSTKYYFETLKSDVRLEAQYK
jgi:predicted metal-dependent HD superfamily phosphohydrolase